MKTFVKDVIGRLVGNNTQFAVAQYSRRCFIHFYFNTFDIDNWQNQIDQITQLGGYTNTAAGIQRVVDNVFSTSGGSRSDVKKILLVITDGVSADRNQLPTVASNADRKSIVRFAIGVGGAFTSSSSIQELRTIASAPQDEHVFQVSSFAALAEIRKRLQDSICSSKSPCSEVRCRVKERCVVEGLRGRCVALSKARCWVFGDPQYTTFDGRSFSFQGTCTYTMVRTTGLDPTLTPFSILTKNELHRNSPGSYLSSATLDLQGYRISILHGKKGTVEVDGVSTNLPVTLGNGSITITEKGIRGTLQSAEGLEVSFDWSTLLMVTVSSSYYGNLQGLCGDYNGSAADDFTTSSGGSTTNVTAWGGSWSVADGNRTCHRACEGECPRCSQADGALYGGPQYCGVLVDRAGPFAACYGKVSGRDFLADCVFAVCQEGGRKAVLCEQLTNYVDECQQAGIDISPRWRTITQCPVACPENSSYWKCLSPCPATCARPVQELCVGGMCVAGCQCDPGYVLRGNRCVDKEKGCYPFVFKLTKQLSVGIPRPKFISLKLN